MKPLLRAGIGISLLGVATLWTLPLLIVLALLLFVGYLLFGALGLAGVALIAGVATGLYLEDTSTGD